MSDFDLWEAEIWDEVWSRTERCPNCEGVKTVRHLETFGGIGRNWREWYWTKTEALCDRCKTGTFSGGFRLEDL